MAKLTRVTGKVFGATASPAGDINNGAYIGQFGSAQTGTFVGTDDIATIQNLPAWSNGWIDAVVETDHLPALPERTGVDKVLSHQECYILQQGVPEWDSATDYYINGFCSYDGVIYKSLTDGNINNQPDVSPANWEVYGQSSTAYTKFAINKGAKTLLTGSSTVLSFDVDLSNPLTFTNIAGNTKTVTSLDNIDVTGTADGTYKVVLPMNSTQPTLYNGTIFNQEEEPTTQVTGDIWLNPQELYTAKQYDGANWQDFNDVVLLDSSVTVTSGVISNLEQPKYNNSHLIANKQYIGGMGMPSKKVESLTLGATATVYKAPANGYFSIIKNPSTTGQYVGIQINNVPVSHGVRSWSSTVATLFAILPCAKDDEVIVTYTANGALTFFGFIYAEGEV